MQEKTGRLTTEFYEVFVYCLLAVTLKLLDSNLCKRFKGRTRRNALFKTHAFPPTDKATAVLRYDSYASYRLLVRRVSSGAPEI